MGRNLVTLVLLIGTVTATATAQTPTHTLDLQTMFECGKVRSLLESSDSKEQAWGAWLAGQSQYCEDTIPLLQQIIKKRLTGTDWRTDGFSLDAALDALIQLDYAKIPTDLISLIYEKSPVQALVLISKLDRGGDAFLLDLAANEKGNNWFAAANMLLKRRTAGTASLLLNNLEIEAVIVISEDGLTSEGGINLAASTGDSLSGDARGYPPLAYYYLTNAAGSGNIVLAPGPKTIYYRRNMMRLGSSPAGPTHYMDGPLPADRLQYISSLLGNLQELPLRATEYRSHKWRGQSALDSEINDFKKDILRRYSELIQMLVSEKLLTPEEASAKHKVKIKVQVRDLRSKQKK
jgi:hypothetical protein